MNSRKTQADTDAPTPASDAELASLAARGDPRAFETIMRRNNQLLFRTVRSILKDDAEAEDAVQEAYLRAYRALGSFRADAKLSTWLVRIAVNEALGRLRRHGSGEVIPLDAAMDAAGPQSEAWMQQDPSGQPETAAMRAQTRRLIEAGIDTLPDAFRTVFVLRAVEELSVNEVAAALGIPEATVRSRFFRARSLIREGLSRKVDLAIDSAFSFAGARCDRIVARVMAKIAEGGAGSRS